MKDKEKRQRLRSDLYSRLESGEQIPIVIKDLRKILAIDQEKFAKMVGLGLSTLRKMEQDQGHYSIQALEKILDKFSLEIVVRKKQAKE